ncbi:transposase, partial [Streptobacillus felis]|uniref:transposase n=1 Tax=Streptobacillus felis TaxID=1384509 RepID=UPI000AACCA95
IKPNIFVTDMFMQFRNVINTTFDNPIIVADKYHVLRQSDWRLRDVRIRLFNSDVKYKELKKFWKLLAKSPTSKYSKKQKYRLNQLFELSSELKGIFNFSKKFYYSFKAKKDIKFKKGIESLIVDLDKTK